MNLTAADLERIRLQAKAVEVERKRTGKWSGGVQAHVAYQKRPLLWINKFLGVPLKTLVWSINPGYEGRDWDGDPDPIVRILEALADGNDVGVESATGTGKTFIAACIVLWFLACFEDSIVSTVAPKEDQLLKHIWKEIGDLWPRFQRHFPQAQLLTGLIRMKPQEAEREKWAASAFVCGVGANEESATKAQGLHAEHMLIITEETPGIHPAIMNALYNTRTDDHNLQLALGNPDHRHDALHQFCMLDEVVHIRISALDHPNIVSGERVVPGAIGAKRLQERITRLGVGSRLYQSRVRGISPSESEEALIRYDWCKAAAASYEDPKFRVGSKARGVDVANAAGGDKAAIARWEGACLTEVESKAMSDAFDASHLADYVVNEAVEEGIDPKCVGVDDVGVGASTINKAKERGFRVKALNGSARTVAGVDVDTQWSETLEDEGVIKPVGPTVVRTERFANLRSQMWWQMREDLRMQRVAMVDDEELFRDLTTPEYTTVGGKITVESKEDIKKRIGRSPDKGDAAVYGNWVRRRTPLRTRAAPLPESTANRDTGLERMLSERAKRDRADKTRQLRLLKKMSRGRR